MLMEWLISALTAAVCTGLAYAMLEVRVFQRIKFLTAKQEEQELDSLRVLDPTELYILLIIIFLLSYICCFFTLKKVPDVIGVGRMLIALACLVGSACVDYREHRIPNLFPAVLAIGGLIMLVLTFAFDRDEASPYFISCAIACIGCAVVLTIASRLTKGGIGFGDIKLLCALGLMCGVYTICYCVFVAVVLCALTGLVLMACKKKTISDGLPFGPFLLIGYVLSTVFFSF